MGLKKRSPFITKDVGEGKTYASGGVVFKDTIKTHLQRQEGTHLLAMDLGAAGACIALARRERKALPLWLRLKLSGDPGHDVRLFSCAIQGIVSGDTLNDSQADLPIDPVSSLKVDIRNYQNEPNSQVEYGWQKWSLKQVLETSRQTWENMGFKWEYDGISITKYLVSKYLVQLLGDMRKLNPGVWGKDPLVEEVLIVVPNTWSTYHRALVKEIVVKEINECGNERKQGLLSTNWVIPSEKIILLNQAEALAAEYLDRDLEDGGFGRTVKGTEQTMLVVDVGAESCDSALLSFKSSECGEAEFKMLLRQSVDLGGDALDKVLAKFLFHLFIKGDLLSLPPEVKHQLFGADAPDKAHLGNRFLALGLFKPLSVKSDRVGRYDLEEERDPNLQLLRFLQNLEDSIISFAKGLKEAITNSFYGFEGSSIRGVEEVGVDFKGERPPAILAKLYELIENFKESEGWESFQGSFRLQLRRFFDTEILLTFHFDSMQVEPVMLNLGDLWEFEPFKVYLRNFTQVTIQHVLDSQKRFAQKSDLKVLFAGRALVFPMIRESLLWAMHAFGKRWNFEFPNKHLSPWRMKVAGVSGAILSRIEGITMSDPAKTCQDYYYLQHFSQETGEENIELMKEESEGPGRATEQVVEKEYRLKGKFLRRRAKSIETLTIIKLQLKLPEVARHFRDYPFEAEVVYKQNIQKMGPFQENGARDICLKLFEDGSSEVLVYSAAGEGSESVDKGKHLLFTPGKPGAMRGN